MGRESDVSIGPVSASRHTGGGGGGRGGDVRLVVSIREVSSFERMCTGALLISENGTPLCT